MRVLIQLPEGLKDKALQFANEWESKGYEVVISSSPSYGACDIPLEECKIVNCDKIVHYGHTQFVSGLSSVKLNFPDGEKTVDIEYIPLFVNIDNLDSLLGEFHKILAGRFKRLGIVTNISHVKDLPKIKEILSSFGYEVYSAPGSARCPYEGQILGCDTSALDKIRDSIDVVVYFGGGRFHALAPGAVDDITKPYYWIDPFSRNISEITEDLRHFQRKRRVAFAKLWEGSVYGILVSTKIGQYNKPLLDAVEKVLNSHGKKYSVITGDTFDFTTLNNFRELDGFINTACPRLVDDQNKLDKPIVNGMDLLQML